MMECNKKLSMDSFVLDECFMTLVDLKTGVDLISHAVYDFSCMKKPWHSSSTMLTKKEGSARKTMVNLN